MGKLDLDLLTRSESTNPIQDFWISSKHKLIYINMFNFPFPKKKKNV